MTKEKIGANDKMLASIVFGLLGGTATGNLGGVLIGSFIGYYFIR